MGSGVFIYGAFVIHHDCLANLKLEGRPQDVRPQEDGTYRLLYNRAEDGALTRVVFTRDFEIVEQEPAEQAAEQPATAEAERD